MQPVTHVNAEIFVRSYKPADYEKVIALYKDGSLFGGQFDLARDSKQKLDAVTQADPESVLVCEDENGHIVGTVSLIENGRVAWLFRFAVENGCAQQEVAKTLYDHAKKVLTSRGHTQILVYSDPENKVLTQRYESLGMAVGGLFRCFWEEVK